MNVKGLTATLVAAVMTISMVTTAGAEGLPMIESTESGECVQIITDHFNSINDGDWISWANGYTPAVRSMYTDFVTNQTFQDNNEGILTVNSVDVISIEIVPNYYAPIYPELANFYSSGSYECYLATLDIETDEENQYFKDGVTKRLIVMVNENDEWGVGASCEYQVPLERGISYGFISGDVHNPPATINVKKYSGGTVSGNSERAIFKDFVTRTVLGEIGTMEYYSEAIKAITLSYKMFSWWCALGHYRDTYGCDILSNLDVAYDSSIDINSNTYGNTLSNISAIIDYYVVSSDGKFFAIGVNNLSQYSYQSSGVVVKSGANALAKQGNLYYQILHYYLDNSSYHNGNVKTVLIGVS